MRSKHEKQEACRKVQSWQVHHRCAIYLITAMLAMPTVNCTWTSTHRCIDWVIGLLYVVDQRCQRPPDNEMLVQRDLLRSANYEMNYDTVGTHCQACDRPPSHYVQRPASRVLFPHFLSSLGCPSVLLGFRNSFVDLGSPEASADSVPHCDKRAYSLTTYYNTSTAWLGSVLAIFLDPMLFYTSITTHSYTQTRNA